MKTILKIGSQNVTTEDIFARIKYYQLLPQLKQELIIDEAIAAIDCTADEINDAYQQLMVKHQVNSDEAKRIFCDRHHLTSQDLEVLLARLVRIEKFKQQMWNHKLESYFLKRKRALDQVIYSMIRVQDEDIAQELYFRIQAGEQSFAELACQYSQGTEAHLGGIVGPVELGAIHPQLAQYLATSQPGQLEYPIPLQNWLIIVRLEKLFPAQLDTAMRQRLLQELFDQWLSEKIDSYPVALPCN